MYIEAKEHILLGGRDKEISHVLGLLEQHPIVFVWAPPTNGKTCFGGEFERHPPIKAEFTYPKGASSQILPEDGNFFKSKIPEDTEIIVFDEFACPFTRGDLVAENVIQEVRGGRMFVLLVHEPRNSYVEYRRYHQMRRAQIVNLVEEYQDTPWIYLRKWKPVKVE